jgi:hypothetical protein
MKLRLTYILSTLAATFALSGSAVRAESIAIVNPSFEALLAADGADASGPNGASGWAINVAYKPSNFTDTQFTGATDNDATPSTIPDGLMVFVLAGGSGAYLTQTLPTTFVAGTEYDLGAWIGARADEAPDYNANYAVQLLRGDTHAVLAQSAANLSGGDRNTWQQVLVNYTADASLAGVPIEVRVLNNGPAWQFSIDQVTLEATAAIPEPSTLALVACGSVAIGAAVVRRRKR